MHFEAAEIMKQTFVGLSEICVTLLKFMAVGRRRSVILSPGTKTSWLYHIESSSKIHSCTEKPSQIKLLGVEEGLWSFVTSGICVKPGLFTACCEGASLITSSVSQFFISWRENPSNRWVLSGVEEVFHHVVTSVRGTTGQCRSSCFQYAKRSKQEVEAESWLQGWKVRNIVLAWWVSVRKAGAHLELMLARGCQGQQDEHRGCCWMRSVI